MRSTRLGGCQRPNLLPRAGRMYWTSLAILAYAAHGGGTACRLGVAGEPDNGATLKQQSTSLRPGAAASGTSAADAAGEPLSYRRSMQGVTGLPPPYAAFPRSPPHLTTAAPPYGVVPAYPPRYTPAALPGPLPSPAASLPQPPVYPAVSAYPPPGLAPSPQPPSPATSPQPPSPATSPQPPSPAKWPHPSPYTASPPSPSPIHGPLDRVSSSSTTPPDQLAPGPPADSPSPPPGLGLLVGAVVGGVCGLIALVALMWYLWRRSRSGGSLCAARGTKSETDPDDYTPSKHHPAIAVEPTFEIVRMGSTRSGTPLNDPPDDGFVSVAVSIRITGSGEPGLDAPPGSDASGLSDGTDTPQDTGVCAPIRAISSDSAHQDSLGDAVGSPEGINYLHGFAYARVGQHRSDSAGPELALLGVTRTTRGGVTAIAWEDLALDENNITGHQGLGTVFKGTLQGTTPVAVRMFNKDRLSSGALEALRRHAALTCNMSHPHLVTVHGLVDDDIHTALVTSYYKRGSLVDVMASAFYSNLGLKERLKMAKQVASGMQYLHEQHPVPLLHGDLTTANVMIMDDGRGLAIADFGLASCLHEAGYVERNTLAAVTTTAPELLDDPQAPCTPAGEIYAFGILLYEIMAGHQAFRRMSAQNVAKAIRNGARPDIPFDVPLSVAEIITDCWAQEAAARPTFAAVVVRLNRAMKPLRTNGTYSNTLTLADITSSRSCKF